MAFLSAQSGDGECTLDRVPEFAERVLGTCQLLADCSWGHRMSSVLRIRDASDTIWFLKRHADRARYRAELTAYRKWLPALQDAAPRLRASDDSLQAIIFSAAPGEAASWPAAEDSGPLADRSAERDVQRQAGKIFHRLHDAQPALPWPDFSAVKLEQFDRLKPAAAALLEPRPLDIAGREIAALRHPRASPGPVPSRLHTPQLAGPPRRTVRNRLRMVWPGRASRRPRSSAPRRVGEQTRPACSVPRRLRPATEPGRPSDSPRLCRPRRSVASRQSAPDTPVLLRGRKPTVPASHHRPRHVVARLHFL